MENYDGMFYSNQLYIKTHVLTTDRWVYMVIVPLYFGFYWLFANKTQDNFYYKLGF